MTGYVIYEPPGRHDCETPEQTSRYRTGTAWQCADCEAVWRLVPGDFGAYWRREGRLSRWWRLRRRHT